MRWDVPSFARYFVILVIAFLVTLYQIKVFKESIALHSFFGEDTVDF